jgi:hypothetical protein
MEATKKAHKWIRSFLFSIVTIMEISHFKWRDCASFLHSFVCGMWGRCYTRMMILLWNIERVLNLIFSGADSSLWKFKKVLIKLVKRIENPKIGNTRNLKFFGPQPHQQNKNVKWIQVNPSNIITLAIYCFLLPNSKKGKFFMLFTPFVSIVLLKWLLNKIIFEFLSRWMLYSESILLWLQKMEWKLFKNFAL